MGTKTGKQRRKKLPAQHEWLNFNVYWAANLDIYRYASRGQE